MTYVKLAPLQTSINMTANTKLSQAIVAKHKKRQQTKTLLSLAGALLL